MTDIKLVIKIPEEVYESAKNGTLNEIQSMYICGSVVEGTPLPKRHGRLIDADVLVDGMEDDYEFCEAVNATLTIIEADKAESEDKE